jgi:hypothetical protein
MTLPGAEDDVDVHDVIVVSVRAHQPDAAGTLSVMTAMSMSGDLSSRARRAWRELRHACATTSAGMQMATGSRWEPT